ncbi:MAG: carbohydrate-binding family 6 protein [Planctomycetota bacterium]
MTKGTFSFLVVWTARFHGIAICLGVAAGFSLSTNLKAETVTLCLDGDCSQAAFAASDIEDALASRKFQTERVGLAVENGNTGESRQRIVLCLESNKTWLGALRASGAQPPRKLDAEGFGIRVTKTKPLTTYWVIGADPGGLMYGGLELAEIIRAAGLTGVKRVDQRPYMAWRGTKFNLPLDARTPTYTEPSDSAQRNIPEMWSIDFWRGYIDNLARCRYNYVSLWSLHPFPSMVRVPDYPDIALHDVKRSTVEWKEYYDLSGRGFDAPEILGNLETVKRMTIDEKIAFWRKVMRYAKDRNVDFYVITWNIFVNGTDGQYGITDDIGNPVTADYFRKSVRRMLLTYPDLAGVGLTTGENMHGASKAEKESWAFKTYGQGVLDAAAARPDRKFVLIHRQHQTGARDIARRFSPLIDSDNVEFIFSFKYAKAHVYSSTRQVYHQAFVKEIGDMKTIWTLRNDDVYHFRWGSPDFVREFIQNIPYDVSRGFYLGSDQYVWGREFMSLDPEKPRQLEVSKHWYHWMLWGRLGYDPTLSNDRLIAILDSRFPEVPGKALFEAWENASMIYPLTTGFHWGALDFQWYIEACKSRPGPAGTESGFHDVNRFITLPPHPGTDFISIPDYVEASVRGRELEGTTPIEVSSQIKAHAYRALRILEEFPPAREIEDKELRKTLSDIEAMACLGRYYAGKIHGATCLARSRETDELEDYSQAEDDLRRAAKWWKRYVSIASSKYKNPIWMNRVGYVDWDMLTKEVEKDIDIAWQIE